LFYYKYSGEIKDPLKNYIAVLQIITENYPLLKGNMKIKKEKKLKNSLVIRN